MKKESIGTALWNPILRSVLFSVSPFTRPKDASRWKVYRVFGLRIAMVYRYEKNR